LIREFARDLTAVCVITATEFAAQLAESSDKKELPDFQQRFRAISVFCCEDIHAIAARPQTQQQLLAVIDELLAHGNDVIISSTKMPGQLESYLPKLVNRFRGGTILTIKLPSSESRLLLLRHFAQQTKVTIPREALALLAESVKVSPRELAGIVTQLAERRGLIKRETIEELLRQDYSTRKITPLRVTKAVATEFQVTLTALRSSTRSQVLVLPRQTAMWLCRKLCGTPLIQLGEFFERQHSSVLHAVRRHEERLKSDASLRLRMTQIELSITRSSPVESRS
jgi:chromosomal replication initiator protein